MEILSSIATDANLSVTLLLQSLATELPEAEHSGFGLNLNILETNVINLAIVIGVLVYLGRGFLGKVLSERRSLIETAIRDAEQRKQSASAALAEQQQQLAQAQAEAALIRSAAEESAETARQSILAEAEQDVERMRSTAAQDLASQQERVIRELRQRVIALAIEKAEARLKSGLSADAQKQLLDRSIALIGGNS